MVQDRREQRSDDKVTGFGRNHNQQNHEKHEYNGQDRCWEVIVEANKGDEHVNRPCKVSCCKARGRDHSLEGNHSSRKFVARR